MDIKIGSRIKHCRRLSGLTRKDFCDRNNIPITQYSLWENGETSITHDDILQCVNSFLSEGIGCSVQWLLSEDGLAPAVIYNSNRALPEKFFERNFDKISPEISAFLDVKSYQKNNPGCVVHQVKNKAMLPHIKVGDFVGGVPLENDKLHFAHQEICIVEIEKNNPLIRIFHKQNNKYVLVASNPSANVINPLVVDKPPLLVAPVEFVRKSTTSHLGRLGDDADG